MPRKRRAASPPEQDLPRSFGKDAAALVEVVSRLYPKEQWAEGQRQEFIHLLQEGEDGTFEPSLPERRARAVFDLLPAAPPGTAEDQIDKVIREYLALTPRDRAMRFVKEAGRKVGRSVFAGLVDSSLAVVVPQLLEELEGQGADPDLSQRLDCLERLCAQADRKWEQLFAERRRDFAESTLRRLAQYGFDLPEEARSDYVSLSKDWSPPFESWAQVASGGGRLTYLDEAQTALGLTLAGAMKSPLRARAISFGAFCATHWVGPLCLASRTQKANAWLRVSRLWGALITCLRQGVASEPHDSHLRRLVEDVVVLRHVAKDGGEQASKLRIEILRQAEAARQQALEQEQPREPTAESQTIVLEALRAAGGGYVPAHVLHGLLEAANLSKRTLRSACNRLRDLGWDVVADASRSSKDQGYRLLG